MLVQLPNGTAIDPSGEIVSAEDNGEIVLHTAKASSRLIEFWKNKPNLRAILSAYTDEIQEAENMLWDVMVLRTIDYASAAQLDSLGLIVGEARLGRSDAAFRVRIHARIAINNSLGRAKDVINVLRIIETARFRLIEDGTATMLIAYHEVPSTAAAMAELPGVVAETRAGGVGALVTFPTDETRGGFWAEGSETDIAYLDSSFYDSTVGAVWGHAARA